MQARRADTKKLKTLKKRADFLKIQKKGKSWVSHGVIVQAIPNDLDHIRIGFTVSKKIHKSAVRRNRIKRRLRAAAADILPRHAKENCDYVLIGRKMSEDRDYTDLCKDLKWCLKKMGYAKTSEET